MLSGIGDPKTLDSLKIKPIIDLPDVGQNMQDHAFVAIQWIANDNMTQDAFNEQPSLFAAARTQYDQTHTGPFSNNPAGNHIGWFRLPEDSPILKQFGDPTGGPNSPHFELMFEVCVIIVLSRVAFNFSLSQILIERILLIYPRYS
jgi:hypothetical protein